MQIHTTFRPRRRDDTTVELSDGATAADLMRAVGEHVDVTVCVRGGAPIPEDAALQDGDEITLVSAASGG